MKKRHSLILRALALVALLILGVIVADSSNPIYQSAPEPPSKLKPEAYETKSTADLINLAEAGDWGALKAFVEKTGFSGPESDLAGRLLLPYVRQGYNEARYKLAEIHLYNSYDLQSIPGLFDNTDFLHSPIESCTDVVSGLKWRREIARDFDSAKKAVALWEEAAAGGHTPSQSRLGLELLTGEHLPPNHPRAIELLDMAARSGDVNSAATLARVYYQGRLIPRDDTKCLEYTRMTKNPVLEAALVLLNGRGDAAARSRAIKGLQADNFFDFDDGLLSARLRLITKPASTAPDFAAACITLGVSTDPGAYDGTFRNGRSAWFDGNPAERSCLNNPNVYSVGHQRAYTGDCLHDAQSGDMLAQCALGESLLFKLDENRHPAATDADKAEGIEWLRKSAAQGFSKAMTRLGLCFQEGPGLKRDRVEAAYWFSMAKDTIWRDRALAALAPEERAGVLRRVAESRRAFALAVLPKLKEQAKSGDPETLFELARVHARLAPDGRADAHALALLGSAAAQGHLPAQRALGLYRLCNDEAHRDLPGALAALEGAARAGDQAAAAVLTRVYYQGKLVARDDAKCLEYAKLTKSPTLVAALVLLNGRGDKASDDEALKGIAPFKDYSGGNAGALWRARIMLRTKPVRSAPEWASWRLRGSDFTASDYDDACSGNLATWFDRAPDEFLRAGVRADAFLDGGDALGPTGTCLHDAQAGDMIAQHVLGHDRLAQAKAFASAGDSARAAETRREATDWLRRSAAQGFTAAMETLANLSGDGFLGAKPDKVEVAYWLSLATTDFYTPNREERDKALAELTPAERAAVAKRAAEARLAIAARFTGAGA